MEIIDKQESKNFKMLEFYSKLLNFLLDYDEHLMVELQKKFHGKH